MLRVRPRYKLAGLLIAVSTLVLFVLFGELPNHSRFWQAAQNFGHTPLFAVIAVLMLLLLRESGLFFRQAPIKLYAVAGVLSLLIGVMVEIVQLMMQRDASTMDVVRDLAGITAGLGLFASIDPYLQPGLLKPRQRAGVVVFSVCVFAASLFSLARLSVAYLQRDTAFPVVVDLTASWSGSFIQKNYATVTVERDKKPGAADKAEKLAHVHFERAIYPGVTMIEPYPDWSSFKVLKLGIYSQQTRTFDIILRIHDKQHNHVYSDRFNRQLTVKAGENHFRVLLHDIKHAPADREMDMTQVSELTLFAKKPVTPLSFYTDIIGLE